MLNLVINKNAKQSDMQYPNNITLFEREWNKLTTCKKQIMQVKHEKQILYIWSSQIAHFYEQVRQHNIMETTVNNYLQCRSISIV
jgi:hypothetical protein